MIASSLMVPPAGMSSRFFVFWLAKRHVSTHLVVPNSQKAAKGIGIPKFTTLKELSKLVKVNPKVLFQNHLKGVRKKKAAYIRLQDNLYAFKSPHSTILPYPVAEAIADQLGYSASLRELEPDCRGPVDGENIRVVNRLPVVVLLGHFNHGKTTLLDALLDSQVPITLKEPYGITQEIRARTVPLTDDLKITVLDTPGQDIFYRLRTDGASAADLALLVVDVDAGPGPQTGEAVGAAEACGLPAAVLLNKVDLLDDEDKGARIKLLEKQLRKFVILENSKFFPISAKTREGLSDMKAGLISLLEAQRAAGRFASWAAAAAAAPGGGGGRRAAAAAVALDFAACPALGQRYLVLLRGGSLRPGDWFVCGPHWGTIRNLKDTTGLDLQEATAGMAVVVGISEKSGIKEAPLTEQFHVLPKAHVEELARVRALEREFHFCQVVVHEDESNIQQQKQNAQQQKNNEDFPDDGAPQSNDFSSTLFSVHRRSRGGSSRKNMSGMPPRNDNTDDNATEDYRDESQGGQDMMMVPIVLKVDCGMSLVTLMDAIEDKFPYVQVVRVSVGGAVTKADAAAARAAAGNGNGGGGGSSGGGGGGGGGCPVFCLNVPRADRGARAELAAAAGRVHLVHEGVVQKLIDAIGEWSISYNRGCRRRK